MKIINSICTAILIILVSCGISPADSFDDFLKKEQGAAKGFISEEKQEFKSYLDELKKEFKEYKRIVEKEPITLLRKLTKGINLSISELQYY